MTIQERIDFLLKQNGISKAELARKLDKPYSTVDNWFKRNSEPGSTLIEPLAHALNVSIEYLITGMDHIEPGTVLPEPEQQLLDYYHAANADGQKEILDHAEYISAKYPKSLGKSSEYKIG